jgi:hypothetical protein
MPDANQTPGSRSHRSLALLAPHLHLVATSTPRCAASQIMHAACEDDSQTPLHRNQPYPILDPGSTMHQRGRAHAYSADTPSASTSAMPRDPFPVPHESGAMPANDRVWLHEYQRLLPPRPESSQHYPEQFVSKPKAGPRPPRFQCSELLPQSKILQQQIAARSKGAYSQSKQEPQ